MIETVREHDLKCHSEPFCAIRARVKRFEWRVNDRDYRVGDILVLREWNPTTGTYTGQVERMRVMYMLSSGYGIPDGYCVMSIDSPKWVPDPCFPSESSPTEAPTAEIPESVKRQVIRAQAMVGVRSEAEAAIAYLANRVAQLERERDHLDSEIGRLAHFIMSDVPGEPSESQGAVDTAIRIIRRLSTPAPPDQTLDGILDSLVDLARMGDPSHVRDTRAVLHDYVTTALAQARAEERQAIKDLIQKAGCGHYCDSSCCLNHLLRRIDARATARPTGAQG